MPESMRLIGLPPVADAHIRVLVLGSFPGAASLAAQQYYGHPRNHFWPLMAGVFEEKTGFTADLADKVCYQNCQSLVPTEYAQRCAWLLAHGVGLWDVYASCEREGSLDAAIRAPMANDLAALRDRCPQLALVAHNGGESARHARHVAALGVAVVRLPSTSPAHASWSFSRKLAAWRTALRPVLRPAVSPVVAQG